MSFLTIFAFIFGGRAVFVGADYFIEFRETTMAEASSSQAQPEITYLYHCLGDPAGIRAINAARSDCNPVTSDEHKSTIYVNCNFFSVYRPNPQGHVIHLVDRGTMSHRSWYLGVLNYAIDHPNFAVPQHPDIDHFSIEVDAIGSFGGVASSLRNRLIFYYAQNNILSLIRNRDVAKPVFSAFVTFLKTLTERYLSLDQENETKKLQFTAAMKKALQKMIDPCSILQGNFQAFASEYCNEYCHFLNLAALHYQVIWTGGCTPLNGGHCVRAVCTCTKLVETPLAGCQTSPMQQCNNSLRLKLNL